MQLTPEQVAPSIPTSWPAAGPNPESELRDYDEWCSQWVESLAAVQRQRIKAHRWEVVQ